MPKLRSFVHVFDDKGVTHVFGPADVVPVWAQAKIVNPNAWAEAPASGLPGVADEVAHPPAVAKATPAKAAPAKKSTRARKTEATED